jgi:hypothetical protein
MPSLTPLTNSYNSHYGCLCFYLCSLPSHISSEVGNRQISCLLWLSTASRIEETSKFCATQNLGRQVVGKCSDRVLTVSDSRSKTLSLCHTEILLCRCQMWQHRPFSLEVDLGCELNFFVPWSNSFPWFMPGNFGMLLLVIRVIFNCWPFLYVEMCWRRIPAISAAATVCEQIPPFSP